MGDHACFMIVPHKQWKKSRVLRSTYSYGTLKRVFLVLFSHCKMCVGDHCKSSPFQLNRKRESQKMLQQQYVRRSSISHLHNLLFSDQYFLPPFPSSISFKSTFIPHQIKMEFLSIFVLSQSLVAVIKYHVLGKKEAIFPFQIKIDQKSAFGKLQPLSTFLCSQNYIAAISFRRIHLVQH